jgi:hypothetical protein
MLPVAAVCLGLWIAPILVAGITRGWTDILVQQGMFFSKAALITFGGAYAIFLALLFFLGLWRGKWEIIPVVFAGGLLGPSANCYLAFDAKCRSFRGTRLGKKLRNL